MLDELRTMDWVPRLVRSKHTKLEETRKALEAETVAEGLQLMVHEFAAHHLSHNEAVADMMAVAASQEAHEGEAEAMASPGAHVITSWLGADLAEPEPHVSRFEPPGPGVVLVCSDAA